MRLPDLHKGSTLLSHLERAGLSPDKLSESPAEEPVTSPGHDVVPVDNREGGEAQAGETTSVRWAARTDVGLVRSHNEDSYLAQPPVFGVCDGMGGHAAGEVASAIAVSTIATHAPIHADDILLGAAVEAANQAVIEGAATGKGKPGMGCTASCVLVERGKMAIAHVGDSRVYLLHAGTLVRLTHDHSYVEELVDAGEITADEARVHPSRSVITRALGSDPDMYADHFTVDVATGDRVIVCSDGLSSMVEDSEIEGIAVSSPTPSSAVDNLVAAALTAGGHDNVSVIVLDVIDDGAIDEHRLRRRHWFLGVSVFCLALIAALAIGLLALMNSSWYVGINGDTVGIYQGINASYFGRSLSHLVETSTVNVADLPQATQDSLRDGVRVDSEQDALDTVESYRAQIDADKSAAAQTADQAQAGTGDVASNPVTPEGADPSAPTEGAQSQPTSANSSSEGGE